MSEYYRVSIPRKKITYYLGTSSAAQQTLPLLVNEVIEDEHFVLWGDETHAWLEDEYNYAKQYEEVDYSSYSSTLSELVKMTELSEEIFDELFEELGGETISKETFLKFIENRKK